MAVSIVDMSDYVIIPKTSEDFQSARFVGKTASGASHVLSDTEMRTLHNMFARWGTSDINAATSLDNFNRFYAIFPDMEFTGNLKSYVFITRPEMNLTGSSSDSGGYSVGGNAATSISADNIHDSRLQYMAAMNPELMYMLTEDYNDYHDFIPFLQGRTESLQLPDYQIRTSDFTIPFYSYKYSYPTVTNESITGGTFDITFREDVDMRVSKLFQFWIYYMDAVIKNKMKPSRYHIINNYYDFMCSVYEIIVDQTAQKIMFWAKYTGCYPTSVPLSNFSHNIRSVMDNKVSITFNYMKVEMLEPAVISDFNFNSRVPPGASPVDVYNTEFSMVSDSLVGSPHIDLTSDETGLTLNWYPLQIGRTSTLSKNVRTLSNIDTALNNAARYRAQVTAFLENGPTVGHSTNPTGLSNHLLTNSDQFL